MTEAAEDTKTAMETTRFVDAAVALAIWKKAKQTWSVICIRCVIGIQDIQIKTVKSN